MTRKEYTDTYTNSDDGTKLHRQFYGQFVTDRVREYVLKTIGLSAIMKSTDEHFNDIPLRIWDSMKRENATISKLMKDIGKDFFTLSCQVCTLKEAARQIKESQK